MTARTCPSGPFLTLSLSSPTTGNTVNILNHRDEAHYLGMAKRQPVNNLVPGTSCSELLQERSKFPSCLNQSYLGPVLLTSKPNPLHIH